MTRTQSTSEGGKSLVVLFYHQSDVEINAGIAEIIQRSGNGEVSNILITEVRGDVEGSYILENGTLREINLNNEISTLSGIFELSRIDIVANCSGRLNKQCQEQLSTAVAKAVLALQLLAAGASINVRDHRIYFPEYGNFGDASGILTGQANSRLVVLPLDKAKDTAVSQEVSYKERALFASHVSTEILSICGLWLTQQGNALEGIMQLPSGDGDQPIQLIRSYVRTASSSLHALGTVVDSFFVGNLPVPQGKLPAPNPYFLAQTAAERVHHRNFRLRPESDLQIEKELSGPELLKLIFKRMIKDLLQIHKIFKHGLQSRVKADIDIVAQDMIGKNAWLQVITNEDKASKSLTQDEIDETINSINQLVDKPENAFVYGEEWTKSLELCLGIVDGAEEAEELRQVAGNPKWVAIEIDSLVPDFNLDLTRMAENLGVVNTQETSEVEAADNRSQPNLLQMITQRFEDETKRARARFSRLVTKLQELKEPDEEEQQLSAGVIKTLFVTSFFIIAFSLLVFSPLHQLFPEGVGAVLRLRLFIIISFPVLLAIAFLFGPRETQQRQIYRTLTFVILTTGTILALRFPSQVNIGSFKWLGAVVVFALAVLVLARFFNIFTSEGSDEMPSSGLALTTCKYVLPIYIFITSVFALNNDHYRHANFDNDSGSFLILTLVAGFALLLSSGFYVSLTRQRQENTFNTWKRQYLWFADEAKEAAYELRLVENYRTQWLGTALVLARLLHYPHGLPVEQDILGDPRISHPSEAQKLQIIGLTPSAAGIQAFTENANRKISEPGWLLNQYKTMVHEFERNQIGLTNNDPSVTTMNPEADPYPVPLSLALSGEASGRRWPFCYRVYEGRYDKLLRDSAIQNLTKSLLETYLDQPNSYETSRGSDSGDDLSKAFSELLTNSQQFWVPAIFGADTAVKFHGQQKLATRIWWPADLLKKPMENENEWCEINTATTSSTMTSIFAQVIRVDVSETTSLSSFLI